MDDENILNLIEANNLKGKSKNYVKRHYPDLYQVLISRFPDTLPSDTITCIVYRIQNGIAIRPVCPVCGKPVAFNNATKMFTITCGNPSCKSSPIVTAIRYERTVNGLKQRYGDDYLKVASKHRQETMLERYGASCIFAAEQHKEEYAQKRKQTCIERFGVDNPGKSPEIKKKMEDTCEQRYGVRNPMFSDDIKKKMEDTCKDKYGFKNAFQNPEVRKKAQETCQQLYGVRNPMQNADIRKKAEDTLEKLYGARNPMQSPEIRKKAEDTCERLYGVRNPMQNDEIFKKSMLNRGFNASPDNETQFAEYLKTKFDKVETQYKTDKYPFHCDVYIGDIDLFIEVQGHWTHGTHPFDKNDENDIELLEKMESKVCRDIEGASNTYANAIYTWTQRDVLKRETAKKNNLRYLEIFSYKIEEIIKLFEEHYEANLETYKKNI